MNRTNVNARAANAVANAAAKNAAANAAGKNAPDTGANIVLYLFRLQLATKMFHWQTTSYAAHAATDKLFASIVSLTDEIIEQYMGVYGRPRMPAGAAVPVPNMTPAAMAATLRDGIAYLRTRLPNDSHIQNVRDELTGAMAQAQFLLTMT
jgi:hypothetical protein